MPAHSSSYAWRTVGNSLMYLSAVCQSQPTRLAMTAMIPPLPGIALMNCSALNWFAPAILKHPYSPKLEPIHGAGWSGSNRHLPVVPAVLPLELSPRVLDMVGACVRCDP